ncbi:MAG: cyanophycinase [Rhodocyclaceae bacterium]|jgi:cyanophycinase|nr:cyanophycinase [Rhodocyclaceae bacterium]
MNQALRHRLLMVVVMLCAQSAVAGWLEAFYATPKGNLLIVGGGDTPIEVQERFVALAGGPGRARIALLPMASTQYDEEAREVEADFRKLGAETRLLNISHEEAQQEAVGRQLREFDAYWFLGGDQSRLAGVLVGTAALEVIERRYEEGATIGGTSAGASVMSSVMLTGRARQPRDAEEIELSNIARDIIDVSKGFGFFKGAIVDQHFMMRPRYNRLISATLDHPQLVGVGIDEETALLVRPDGVWEVLGRYYVKLFDARRARVIGDAGPMARASDIRMHVLPAGSTFNPKNRKVTFPAN